MQTIVGNHGHNRFAAFDTTTFGISLCTPGHQYFVEKLCSAIGSGPVDPPTLTWRSHPEQGLHRSAACEVMAELVAESAQKRTVRGDLFLDGGPHPETDE